MTTDQPDEEQFIRYLLGQLAPETRADIEEQYLRDPACLERLELAESELIERYLEGDLSREQKIHFEEQYLANPERRRKVEIAALLIRRFHRQPRRVFLKAVRYGLAAALALAFSVWVVYMPSRVPGAVTLKGTGNPRALGQLEQHVSVARNAPVLRLRLDVRGVDSTRIDHAVLRVVEDETPIWYEKIHAGPAETSVDILIQSSVLEERDYILALENKSEAVASFSFRLQKE